jgi:hypothetical protein
MIYRKGELSPASTDKLDEREMLAASRAKRTIGKAVATSADDPEADLVLVWNEHAHVLALLENATGSA